MKRPDFDIPTHPGFMFSWSKKERAGVCEASDLGNLREPALQVWDDACDIGFYIESHQTGALKLFTLTDTKRDREGDIELWTFESEDGVQVNILND